MRFDDVFICYSDLKTILKGIDSSTTSKELARYVFELYAGADIGSIDMSKLKTGMIDEYNYMDDFQETDWIKEALYFEKILNNHVLEDNRESMEVLDEAIHGFDCVLLDKKTDNETLSKKIFESAQRSLGKLYGNIATDTKNQVFSTPNSNPKPQNTFSKIISKITNIFKK